MTEKAPLRAKKPTEKPAKKPKRGDRWNRFGLVLLVIFLGSAAYLGGQLGGAVLSEILLAPFDALAGIEFTLAQYLILQAIVVALLAGIAYVFRSNLKELGLGRIKNWTYLLLLPLIYIATLILGAAASLIATILLPDYNAAQQQELGLPPVGEGDLLLTGFFLVIAVPIIEEFIFRGYLQGLIRRYAPFWLTAVLVSAIFGAAHGQLNVAINVFILSLALCYMREKTGSIWSGVGLHALKNFIAFLLLFVFNVI